MCFSIFSCVWNQFGIFAEDILLVKAATIENWLLVHMKFFVTRSKTQDGAT